MSSSSPEKLSGDRKKAIQELIQGRELANQLRFVLDMPFSDRTVAAEDLVTKILGSFSETISILSCAATGEISHQIPAKNCLNSPSWDGRKSDDSDEISSKNSALKERRGCYKRRKKTQTWTRTAPNLIEDGHAWRKYGQKVILNAKHPRNYYRCTHKFDQPGCQATKQVQRTDDDGLPMYRTTYHGYHTCKDLLKPPQLILDSIDPRDSSMLLSFDSANPNNKPNEPYFPTLPSIKQEYQEKKTSTFNQIQSSPPPSDYLMMTFGSCWPMTTELPSGSDHGDVISSGVYSCTASTHSIGMDMDMVVGDFNNAFEFEF